MKQQLSSLLSPKTTYKGKSSFQTYSDFLQWENFIQEQLASLPQSSALQRGFQTCEHWKQIFMEIIGECHFPVVFNLTLGQKELSTGVHVDSVVKRSR